MAILNERSLDEFLMQWQADSRVQTKMGLPHTVGQAGIAVTRDTRVRLAISRAIAVCRDEGAVQIYARRKFWRCTEDEALALCLLNDREWHSMRELAAHAGNQEAEKHLIRLVGQLSTVGIVRLEAGSVS